MIRKIRNILLLLIIILFTSCGSPLGPKVSEWQVLHTMEAISNYFHFSVSPSGDYYIKAIDPYDRKSKIYKFDGDGFKVELELEYDEYNFGNIAYLNDEIWVPVDSYVDDIVIPSIMKNDGSGWVQTQIEYDDFLSISKIYPVAEDEFWIEGRVDAHSNRMSLLYYDNGVLRSFASETSNVTKTAYSSDGFFYALDEPYNNTGIDKQYRFILSNNGGSTWVEEELALSGDSIYEINNTTLSQIDIYAVPGALFLQCTISSNDAGYEGIVKRTGPPGEGIYTIEFLSPKGPHFWNIEGMLFNSINDGICVGHETTVLYRNGKWLFEESESIPEYYFNIPIYMDSNSSGYYVLTQPPGHYYFEILYHP